MITIQRKKLEKMIKAFRKVVPKGAAGNEFYGMMHISREGFRVFNVDTKVSYSYEMNIDKDYYVDFNTFSTICSSVSGESVAFDFTDDRIDIIGEVESSMKFLLEVEDYPHVLFRQWDSLPMVNFKMSDLEYSFLAISTDITRQHLNNVLLSETGSICTDGHRLHMIGIVGDKTCLLPFEGYMLVKAFGGEDASIQYSKGAISQVVKIVSGDLTIYHNICEDQFPPYEQVIPKFNDASIDFDTSKLLAALKSLKKISKGDKVAGVVINIEAARSGMVNVRYKNGDIELSVDIPCKMKSDDDYDVKEIGLRLCYLFDALRKKEKNTKLLMNSALDPATIKYDDSIAVIMPLRI